MSVRPKEPLLIRIEAAERPEDDGIEAWRALLCATLGEGRKDYYVQGGFVACDACAAKPGSPALCSGCLANRDTISNAGSKVQVTEELRWLLDYFVGNLLQRAPLPWRLEYDWTVEVTAANDTIVAKVMNAAQAQVLIELATDLAQRDKAAEAEVAKLMGELDE